MSMFAIVVNKHYDETSASTWPTKPRIMWSDLCFNTLRTQVTTPFAGFGRLADPCYSRFKFVYSVLHENTISLFLQHNYNTERNANLNHSTITLITLTRILVLTLGYLDFLEFRVELYRLRVGLRLNDIICHFPVKSCAGFFWNVVNNVGRLSWYFNNA